MTMETDTESVETYEGGEEETVNWVFPVSPSINAEMDNGILS